MKRRSFFGVFAAGITGFSLPKTAKADTVDFRSVEDMKRDMKRRSDEREDFFMPRSLKEIKERREYLLQEWKNLQYQYYSKHKDLQSQCSALGGHDFIVNPVNQRVEIISREYGHTPKDPMKTCIYCSKILVSY